MSYLPHRWMGTGGGVICLRCGLRVEDSLDRDPEYRAPSCPGKDWTCPVNDIGDGKGSHLLVADGAGGAECYYCSRPDKGLAEA